MIDTRAAGTMNHPTIQNMVRAARMTMRNAIAMLMSKARGPRTESGVAVSTMATRSEMATLPISIEVWRRCLTVVTRRQVRRRVACQNLSVLAVRQLPLSLPLADRRGSSQQQCCRALR